MDVTMFQRNGTVKRFLLLFSELAHVGAGVRKSCLDGSTTVEAENYIMN